MVTADKSRPSVALHELRRSVRRAWRGLRLPPREILTTARAFMVLLVVELLIRWVPLPRLSQLLGVRLALDPAPPDVAQLSIDELPDTARRQLRCTWRAAEGWPLSEGPCLRRALVGGHLIRDLRPAVRLGVARDGDTLHAHAWLEIDHRPLEEVTPFQAFQMRPTARAR